MPERSPFERLFDPSNDTSPLSRATGTLGRVFGVPTQQERSGQVTSEALKHFSDLMTDGSNRTPQQALLEFMKTPQGVDMLVHNPEGLKQLGQFQGMVTPPAPVIGNIGVGQMRNATDARTGLEVPGSRISNPSLEQQNRNIPGAPTISNIPPGNIQTVTGADGQQISSTANPSLDLQNRNDLISLSKLPPDQLAIIAEATLTPDPQKMTAADAAIRELIKLGPEKGGLSKEMGLKLIGGPAAVIRVIPRRNSAGELTGDNTIIDLSNMKTYSTQGLKTEKPPTIPSGAVNPDGTVDAKKVFDDRGTMFFGAGISPAMVGTLHSILQIAGPGIGLSGGEGAIANRDYMQQLRVALTNLGAESSGNRATSGAIKEIVKLGTGFGPLVQPQQAARQGLRLWDMVQNEISRNETIQTDLNQPHAAIKHAFTQTELLQRVHEALPPRDKIVEIINSFATGTSGAMGVSSVIGAVKEAVSQRSRVQQEVTGTPDAPAPRPTDFRRMTEQQLDAIDYKTLSLSDLRKYRRRVEEIENAKRKR